MWDGPWELGGPQRREEGGSACSQGGGRALDDPESLPLLSATWGDLKFKSLLRFYRSNSITSVILSAVKSASADVFQEIPRIPKL